VQIAQHYFGLEEQEEEFSEFYAQLDAHIDDLEATRASPTGSDWNALPLDRSSGVTAATADTIFYDVDD
jgi:hypothetical protein